MTKIPFLVALLLLPLAAGQTIPTGDTTEFDDFESYSLGAFSGDKEWYTATGASEGPCDPTTYCKIVAPGLDGTNQGLLKTRPAAGEIQIDLTVKPEFVSPALSEDFVVSFHGQLTQTGTATTMFIGSDFTDANIQATFFTTGAVTIRGATTACGTTRGASAALAGIDSLDDHHYTLVFRTNSTVDIFVDDVYVQTEFNFGCLDVDIIAFQQASSTTDSSTGFLFDQWIWGGTNPAEEEAPREPSEFDSGLSDQLGRIGFIEPGSQLFFILIFVAMSLIGSAAATRMMSPGKFKNNMVAAIPALFAMFGILLGFLDLWMFLLSFALTAFVVNASGVLRNTYFQLVDAAANATDSIREAFSREEESRFTVTSVQDPSEVRVPPFVPQEPDVQQDAPSESADEDMEDA